MKMTISAWSTVTSSSEMPEYDCIRLPPARSAPNSSAASSTPHGLTRPSSATRMPSKPMLPTTGGVSALALVPSTMRRAAEAGQRAGDDHDQRRTSGRR